jgi:hypothetical protein
MTRVTEIEDVVDIITLIANVPSRRIMVTGIVDTATTGNPTHVASLAWGPWLNHALHGIPHTQLLDFEAARDQTNYRRITMAIAEAAQTRRHW